MSTPDSFLVRFAYAVQASKKYQNLKKTTDALIESHRHKYSHLFNYFMMILIFSSVFILIYEVKNPVDPILSLFNDYIISIFFLIEYILRFWIYGSVTEIIIKEYEKDQLLQRELHTLSILKKVLLLKFNYIRSLSAIIDLLAIMPFFHELRLFRLFILFRVFKIFRYTQSIQSFLKVLKTKKFEFITLLSFGGIIIFISAVMIYVMEANVPGSKITTLFDAFYWSLVTISTVGFGDYVPVTTEGRVVAMVIIISGIGVISFATSIIVSAFTEQLDEIREHRDLDSLSKLKNFYLILGYDHLGEHIAGKLKRLNRTIIVMDARSELIALAKKHGYLAFNFNPGLLSSYKRLNIDFNTQVKTILALHSSDIVNVYCTLTLRSINKSIPILSVLHHEINRKKLELAGVNTLVYTQQLVGMVAKEFAGEPVAFEAIHALRNENSGVAFEEIFVTEHLANHYPLLKTLHYHKYHLICLGIEKAEGKFIFNPKGDTNLQKGDIILLSGLNSLLLEFKRNTL